MKRCQERIALLVPDTFCQRKLSEGAIMKIKFVLLGVLLTAFTASFVNHALNKSGKRQIRELKEPPVYDLDVEHPLEFIKKNLPGTLERSPDELFGLDALDGTAKVCIRRGAASAEMDVELITGTELPSGKGYTIFFAGTPATLGDTYDLALRLCELAKIPNDRIVAWYKEKKYESPLDSSQLQTAREGERQHSVTVRGSLELSGDKQWRVTYEILFPGAKAAAPDSRSKEDD